MRAAIPAQDQDATVRVWTKRIFRSRCGTVGVGRVSSKGGYDIASTQSLDDDVGAVRILDTARDPDIARGTHVCSCLQVRARGPPRHDNCLVVEDVEVCVYGGWYDGPRVSLRFPTGMVAQPSCDAYSRVLAASKGQLPLLGGDRLDFADDAASEAQPRANNSRRLWVGDDEHNLRLSRCAMIQGRNKLVLYPNLFQQFSNESPFARSCMVHHNFLYSHTVCLNRTCSALLRLYYKDVSLVHPRETPPMTMLLSVRTLASAN